MKSKKAYMLILIAALALGAAGCGNSTDTDGSLAETLRQDDGSGENRMGTDGTGEPKQGEDGAESSQEDSSLTGQGDSAPGSGKDNAPGPKEDNTAALNGEDGAAQSRESAPEAEKKTPAQAGTGAGPETEGENMEEIEILQVPQWPRAEIPETEALAFVEAMGLGWSLGNTFDAADCNVNDELQYESAWSKAVTTKEMVQAVADAGFHTIRIPVSWHNHLDDSGKISSTWMDRVQEVVDWAIDEDMYVIINIHHDNEEGFMYPSYEQLEQSLKYVDTIWEQIAERFADYDEKLIFEVLNEPRQKGTDHEWWIDVNSQTGKECLDAVNQLNQAAVDAIRENGKGYNSTRYIMVPGYCASADFALADGFVLPGDSGGAEGRILVSVHAYTPYSFALAGETEQNSTDRFSISGQIGTGEIDAFMERLYEKYISRGTGVVIGEFGARIKDNNTRDRAEYAAYYVARARHFGITVCWWDNNAFAGNGENFGLLKRGQAAFAFPEIVAQMVHYSRAE